MTARVEEGPITSHHSTAGQY